MANAALPILSVDEIRRFKSRVIDTGGCHEWSGYRNPKGYGLLKLRGIVVMAHRVSYRHHYDEIPDGLQVCHKCDNPSCVNPDHLFLGTNLENAMDRVAKGRVDAKKGEAHHNCKLTASDVTEIRRRHSAGEARILDLSREYGVNPPAIHKIVSGKTWKHLTHGAACGA